jgi:hypothetical protein
MAHNRTSRGLGHLTGQLDPKLKIILSSGRFGQIQTFFQGNIRLSLSKYSAAESQAINHRALAHLKK